MPLEPSPPGIEQLIGEELNIVAFVMGYVEFHFNGPVLRALADPIVVIDRVSSRFPEAGSRDQLCRLIGKRVAAVSVVDDVAIEVSFNDDARLRIPLDAQSRVGPEAANFQSQTFNSPDFWVW
jgi:hypothetical protein